MKKPVCERLVSKRAEETVESLFSRAVHTQNFNSAHFTSCKIKTDGTEISERFKRNGSRESERKNGYRGRNIGQVERKNCERGRNIGDGEREKRRRVAEILAVYRERMAREAETLDGVKERSMKVAKNTSEREKKAGERQKYWRCSEKEGL